MTNPVRPDIKINGTSIPSPTEIQYIFPETIGFDGAGNERFFQYYSVDLTWNHLTHEEYQVLYKSWVDYYAVGLFSTVRLPDLYNTITGSYAYLDISGCIVDAPKISGPYLQNYHSNIKMRIRKITP